MIPLITRSCIILGPDLWRTRSLILGRCFTHSPVFRARGVTTANTLNEDRKSGFSAAQIANKALAVAGAFLNVVVHQRGVNEAMDPILVLVFLCSLRPERFSMTMTVREALIGAIMHR